MADDRSVDKSKAIEAALSNIEKKFGKGSIMRLGEREVSDVPAISTTSLSLDIAVGVGGVPRGRIVEIYGPESSGKTTLALHIVAEAQRAGGVAAYIDAEHALDADYAGKLGVDVDLGVEAGGRGNALGEHAARFNENGGGHPGVLQGTLSYVLQDQHGQIATTHSISAGLDYPSIGPEHAFLHDSGRVEYVSVSDDEALEAFTTLSKLEGIIPALESAHAVAHALKVAKELTRDELIIINLSGRGDKDVDTVRSYLEQHG